MAMKTRVIAVAALAQLALALLLTGLTMCILFLMLSFGTLKHANTAQAAYGLAIGAAMFGIPGVASLFASWGLWKRRLWGWWLALLSNVALCGLFGLGVVADGPYEIDWTVVALAAICAGLTIFLLLPPVRRACLRNEASQITPALPANV
jgi:uncharacterized membrane protein (DUF2068 family)